MIEKSKVSLKKREYQRIYDGGGFDWPSGVLRCAFCRSVNMSKEALNPPTLFPSRQYGFSQIVKVSAGKMVYLSGQVAWDADQNLLGKDDLGTQTRQALKNVRIAIQTAGGTLADVVSLRIYIVQDRMAESHYVREGLREFFPGDSPPAATWIGVHSLADEDFLIEIEAVAVIDVEQPLEGKTLSL
jgi:2-iminobutanoate/2-iminopropanoate deaminase